MARSSRLTIGIVAGEPSGDILAAGLMQSIREKHADAHFIGIGGPMMAEQGFDCLFPMDDITMMGLELGRVKSILKIRRTLSQALTEQKLDAFVGVDVPDFNLTLELKLRQQGLPTIHYVSPTVWAWRGYRIKKIRRAVGRMLTLFPFEQQFYRHRQMAATFVGHSAATKARQLREILPRAEARDGLVEAKQIMIALLPGSRRSEVDKLLLPMLEAAELIHAQFPQTRFVLPIAKPSLRPVIKQQLKAFKDMPVQLLTGESSRVLHAADLTIVASGTAALEALLHLTPMVVVYKVSRLTLLMVKLFGHVKYYSMPNHLLPKPIVPELIQEQVTAELITTKVVHYLQHPAEMAALKEQFKLVAGTLEQDSSQLAAQAVLAEINAS